MAVRTYTESIREVFSHVGCDRELIKALAYLFDSLGEWKNPDDQDYQAPMKVIPRAYVPEGKMCGNKYELAAFKEHFAAEVFLYEIRRAQTLPDLAHVYKRLKKGGAETSIPSVVFQNILRKMLWLSSGRGEHRSDSMI